MGADLIGHSLTVGLRSYKKILTKSVDTYDRILKDVDTDKLTDDESDRVLLELQEAGLRMDSLEGLDTVDIINIAKDDLELARGYKPCQGYHDMASMGYKINEEGVRIEFAVDMGWGDEPDGAGYAVLRAMDRLGIGDKFYDAIPWGNKKA
jgi:hypothetical protein